MPLIVSWVKITLFNFTMSVSFSNLRFLKRGLACFWKWANERSLTAFFWKVMRWFVLWRSHFDPRVGNHSLNESKIVHNISASRVALLNCDVKGQSGFRFFSALFSFELSSVICLTYILQMWFQHTLPD